MKRKKTILSVSEDKHIAEALESSLSREYSLKTAKDLNEAKELISGGAYPEVLVLDTSDAKDALDVSGMLKLRETEFALKVATEQLTALVNNVPAGIATFEISPGRAKVLYFNKRLAHLLGLSETEFSAIYLDNAFPIVIPEDERKVTDTVTRCISNDEPVNMVFRAIKNGGGYLWLRLNAVSIGTSNGLPILYSIFSDITREKEADDEMLRMNAELRRRADCDMLTGIYNRRAFCDRTRRLLNENPSREYELIRFNIERFKVINDLYGPDTADALLIQIANTLRETIPPHGTYGRLGGDHFVICIPENYFDMRELHDQILSCLNKLSLDYSTEVDLGVYRIKDRTTTVTQMCDRANLALQTINGNYGVWFSYYDDTLRSRMLSEQEILNDMRTGIDEEQFCINLQPIWNAEKKHTVSAEALCRWMHPRKGMLSPAEFIPLFEKNGFISSLDMYVWRKVCEYRSARIRRGMPEIPISVNLSRISLYKKNVADEMLSACRHNGISPEMMKIEITESAYNDDPRQLVHMICRLREYGFVILMDDFGSGYSSLNAMKELPVDIIKIDMKFIENFKSGSDRAKKLYSSIINMSQSLGIPVIAEGVEEKEQYDFLMQSGCNLMQGYYISRPLAINDFELMYQMSDNPAVN